MSSSFFFSFFLNSSAIYGPPVEFYIYAESLEKPQGPSQR